jgi:hypothetical protein
VPALNESGSLTLLAPKCQSAVYHLTLDRKDVSSEGATLRVDIGASCQGAGPSVRWALAMVGPIHSATRATARSTNVKQDTDTTYELEIRKLDHDRIDNASVITGISDVNAAESISMEVLIEVDSVAQRDGPSTAIGLPAVGNFFLGDPEEGTSEPVDVRFTASGDMSESDAITSPEIVSLRAVRITTITVDLGRLNTAERLEFASPPLSDPGTLRWELEAERGLITMIADTNEEQDDERRLFGAGVLAGLAASLLVWFGEVIPEARKMGRTRGSDTP